VKRRVSETKSDGKGRDEVDKGSLDRFFLFGISLIKQGQDYLAYGIKIVLG
jgi:hypothetical protein